jgi:tetratricopeptide (TPR) repeat protein
MSKLATPQRTATILSKGRALHRAGQYPKASKLYAEVLATDPTHADALHLLGLVARQTGDHANAESLIRRAISSDPTIALYHRDLAQICVLLNKRPEAIQSYSTALTLDPDLPETALQLAKLLVDANDLEAATQIYKHLLARNPDSVEAHFNLGCLQRRRNQLPAAIQSYRKAAALAPRIADIHFNLAVAHFASGQFAEAAQAYIQALTLKPNDAEAHYSLGVTLQEMGNHQAAADSYRRALALKPDYPDALSNLGSAVMDLGDLTTAEQLLRRCIALAPRDTNAHCNLGSILQKQGDTSAAIASFRNALTLDPRHILTLCNLGTLLDLLGEIDSALQCYLAALTVQPTCAQARFSLSTHLLAAGDLPNGWREYESRWDTRTFRPIRRTFTQPQWRGEDIRNARIFLYAEQGFGDTLQFVRFVTMVADRAAGVILEVQPQLLRLLQNLHPNVRVIASAAELDPTSFDWQCPLLSLPIALNIDLQTIPVTTPYLQPDPADLKHWRDTLAPTGLRIGLVWCGNPKHTRDAQRSIPLTQLLRLFEGLNATLYSLQKGPAAQQCAGTDVIDLDPQLKDFADTAAAVANLDLVIAVDTAVAHLAGALGKPIWILIHNAPDWRWLRNRTDSPWYPAARLFRQQSAGDWSKVFEQMKQALTEIK